jgi:hypothetical protein
LGEAQGAHLRLGSIPPFALWLADGNLSVERNV